MLKKSINTLLIGAALLLAVAPIQARDPVPYKGDPKPAALQLKDIAGRMHNLGDYRGQVVLVNFWATWCPPCRAEMPSMWKLQNAFRGKPFRILAVNMAETDAEVNTFLPDRMKQDFVVLMDRDGAALKNWKVFAFPTSFIIDKRGRVRYGLFGATEWDSKENQKLIETLINE